ncbi:MAG: hypothetical protein M4D80_14045 [Myxococcota bacterium]|nr:hypothetical protein [Myxococcota bacterium]
MAVTREVIAEIGRRLAARDGIDGCSRRDYEVETFAIFSNHVGEPRALKAIVTRVRRIRTV